MNKFMRNLALFIVVSVQFNVAFAKDPVSKTVINFAPVASVDIFRMALSDAVFQSIETGQRPAELFKKRIALAATDDDVDAFNRYKSETITYLNTLHNEISSETVNAHQREKLKQVELAQRLIQTFEFESNESTGRLSQLTINDRIYILGHGAAGTEYVYGKDNRRAGTLIDKSLDRSALEVVKLLKSGGLPLDFVDIRLPNCYSAQTTKLPIYTEKLSQKVLLRNAAPIYVPRDNYQSYPLDKQYARIEKQSLGLHFVDALRESGYNNAVVTAYFFAGADYSGYSSHMRAFTGFTKKSLDTEKRPASIATDYYIKGSKVKMVYPVHSTNWKKKVFREAAPGPGPLFHATELIKKNIAKYKTDFPSDLPELEFINPLADVTAPYLTRQTFCVFKAEINEQGLGCFSANPKL